jgi:UDP-2,3-diacylglucosamine pyrophosphatase LpxH
VGDLAKRLGMGSGRCLFDIIKYVYFEDNSRKKSFSVSDAIKWSEVLLEFDENKWLLSSLKNILEENLKKYDRQYEEYVSTNDITKLLFGDLSASEVSLIKDYHEDKKNKSDLLYALIGHGLSETKTDWDNNYIYFRAETVSGISAENKKQCKVKKSKWQAFLWMDVGAWSPHSAVVGIVTQDEIAMYDVYGSRKNIKTVKRPAKGTLADQILESLSKAFSGGRTVFYQNLRNVIKTPVTKKNEIIFVLPDLHLHLFKGFKADNFKQHGSSKPLDEMLAKALSVINHWSSQKSVKIVQVGDLYELWESAMLLCIGLNPDMECVKWAAKAAQLAHKNFNTLTQPPLFATLFKQLPNSAHIDKMKKYIKSIEAEAKRRKLHKIFEKTELAKLRRPWAIIKGDKVETNAEIKDVWKQIQKEIEKLHQVLFKKASRGKLNTSANQTLLAGNHDSFIDHIYVLEGGISNVIRFEHLHYNDQYNKPSNMRAGQFFTILNLIAETLGFGDQIKALETSRRDMFFEDVAAINWYRYKEDKPMYELIITGHTHRAYAQYIKLKLSKSKFKPVASIELYNEGWSKKTTIYQKYNAMMFVIKNLDSLLAGIAAMGWRGLVTTLYLELAKLIPGPQFPIEKRSKPFPVE